MRNLLLTLRSALLLLLLAVTVPIASADVYGDFVENGIWYVTTSDNTVAVTRNYDTPYSGDITIPRTVTHTVYANYEEVTLTFVVSSIDDNAFSGSTGLTSVTMPNTIKSIGYEAFYGCSRLSKIDIPNGVETIGRAAFQNCTGLTQVTMANSVRTLGDNLFYGCTGLRSVKLSSSVQQLNGTFFGCTSLSSIEIPYSVISLNSTFASCTSLSSVVLPGSLTTIGLRSFEDCSSLKSLYIPNSVITIDEKAFNNAGLTSLEIPCTTTSIGSDAFMNCNGLTSVTSRAMNPPVMANSGCFSNDTYNLASFYVPNIVKNVYGETNWWSSFVNRIGKEDYNNVYDGVSNGIYYRIIDSNAVSVTFKDNNYNSYSGSVTIPSSVSINGKTYQVTEVGYNAFKDCSGLTSVTIPSSVTKIAPQAFRNTGLTSLNLPDGLQYIGSAAFTDCKGLSSLTVPASVAHIGNGAFAGCDGIANLVWNAKNCHTNGNLSTVSLSRVTIGNQVEALPVAFVSGSAISQVTIPETVTAIGDSAFYDCSGLTELKIPSSVVSIGNYAFYGSTGLRTLYWNAIHCATNGRMTTYNITSATIGDGVEILPLDFLNGSQITSISLPASLKLISSNAFYGCEGLTSLVIPEAVHSIGPDAFAECYGLKKLTWNAIDCDNTGSMSCDNITQVTIGERVTLLPDRFCEYAQVTSVNLPSTLKSIGDYAFRESQLQNIIIPSSVESIGREAFRACQLQSLEIPSGVKSIGEEAFLLNSHSLNSIKVQSGNPNYDSRNNCNALIETATNRLLLGCKSTSLPNTVTGIGSYAFYGCSGLEEITIPNTVTWIGESVFSDCSGLKTVYFNAGNCEIENDSYGYSGSIFPSTLERMVIGDNVTAIPDYFLSNCSGLTSITIPNSVTSIGKSAFSGCSGLTSITIPNAVTSIGSSAFYGCSGLTSITIPNSVTSIGGSAFSDCSGLTSITIPNSVTTIESYTFSGCSGLTEITIPAAVTTIENGAFSGCSGLTEITIPAAVAYIGNRAFENCSSLKTVNYNAQNCQIQSNYDYYTSSYKGPFPTTLERMVIGDNVTAIPDYLLSNCSGLTSITIPDAVTAIGKYAFSGCAGLKAIKIPQSVASIGEYAFNKCTGLTSITLPDAVTAIKSRTFQYCSALSSVTIGGGVESINDYAFNQCPNLQSFTSYTLVPPVISSSYLYGVPETMVVYVPAVVIEDYRSARGWKNYTIEPLTDNKGLTVRFPDGTNMSDYAGMRLAVSSTDGEKSSHYTVSNKTSYVFNALNHNLTWRVDLTNQWGDEFGKIENLVLQEQNSVATLDDLLEPHNVALTVVTPDGQDVTARCKVSWTDENGELLTQGNEINRLPAGRKLKYQVILPQELATAYALPASTAYTVKDGNNTIVCQLTAISQINLSGRVKDATAGQPLTGATVSAIQSFGDNNTRTMTAQTDNQGNYSMEVASVPTTLTVAAMGYLSQTVECDMTGSDAVTVPDMALSPITGTVVNIKLTYTPARLQNEPAETQNWYSDYSNVDYTVYNKTKNEAVTVISVQYPQIILMEGVDDGDVLELTATSRTNAFKPVKATVTIGEQAATATFNIVEPGKVAAKLKRNINPAVVGTLYDADDKLVTSQSYRGDSLTLSDLPDGEYKLITMGKSDFFNSIYDLSGLAEAGLKRGVDYARNDVAVATGLITPVVINEVPFLDETKLYYTGDNTSFTVNKPSIVIGNYLTFRAQVDFKEQYAAQVSDVQLIVDLPESCHFYEGSVLTAGQIGGYTQEGNRIIIPLSDNNAVVRFCTIPTMGGDFAPSAFVQFTINGKTVTQPIGSAPYEAKSLSILVPSFTADSVITVSGIALPGSTVRVFDGEVQIAETQCLANGEWRTAASLYMPYDHTHHYVYAKVKSHDLLELTTEVKIVEYDKTVPQVLNVTMVYDGQEIVFDQKGGKVTPNYYLYVPGYSTFTFTAKFWPNDTSLIGNVEFKVLDTQGEIRTLEGDYDGDKGIWFVVTEYPDSYKIPVNATVNYNRKNVSPVGGTQMSHEASSLLVSLLEELQTVYAEGVFELLSANDNTATVLAIPNGYSNQENYNIRSLDYNTAISMYDREGCYKIVNDTAGIDVGIYETHSDDGFFSLIIWDNIDKEAYSVNSLSFNPNLCEGPNRVGPAENVISAIGSIAMAFAEYFIKKGYINEWIKTLEVERMNQAAQYHKMWSYLNEKCSDGSYRIKSEEVRAIEKARINKWKEESDEALEKLDQIIQNITNWVKCVCVTKATVGIVAGSWIKIHNKTINSVHEWFKKHNVIFSLSLNEKRNIAIIIRQTLGQKLSLIIGDAYFNDIDGVDLFDSWCAKPIEKWHEETFTNLNKLECVLIKRIRSEYSNCSVGDQKDDNVIFVSENVLPSIDPSGFVYEGVPSNRLQGVTATCYYKETVEDMYGDPVENVVLWDAEQYGQQNPLLTDENGYYRWDVPIGQWQVKYEKEGYETTYSDWLPVPPPQLDVNIGMVQMRQPEVIKARAYSQAVEVEFDKFMLPETLTPDNIIVTVEGSPVNGTIELLNAEVDDPTAITSLRRAKGTGLTLASKVRFNASSPFYATKVTLCVKRNVESYAELQMNEDYVAELNVEPEMTKIYVDSVVNVPYGDSHQLTVTVVAPSASKGKKLTVRSALPMIASTDAETYTINRNGRAVITIHGDLPGTTSLLFGIEDYDLTASTIVNVMMESQMTVAMPTASVATGSEVTKGTPVYLQCATEGATIYYTLDGSCPCDDTPARMTYDGSPIIIEGDVTIKAMATAPNLYDSEVATFTYRLSGVTKGDVNADGDVNIADVNATISIVLGGEADSQTMGRADVNGDGEINLADINTIIEMILNATYKLHLQPNCSDQLHAKNLLIKPGETRTIDVKLDNSPRYSAMQCDLVLPAGLTLVDVAASNGSETKAVELSESTWRMVDYSLTKRPFDREAVLKLTVRADASLATMSEIALTHVVLADGQDVAWRVADCMAMVNNATAVNDLNMATARVWVEGRTLCIDSPQDGTVQLVAISGVVQDFAVMTGVNRHEVEQGVYVVIIGGKSHKIVVK